MRYRVGDNGMGVRAIGTAAVILQPSGVSRVLVEVLRRYAVVLARHHAAQAGEERLHLIGVRTIG